MRRTRQLLIATLKTVLHKFQLQHFFQLLLKKQWGGNKLWTYPLWNTSNLIPLDRIARRKPLWFRLMFNLNNWLYSTVKIQKNESKLWKSNYVQCSITCTYSNFCLSQFGPFVKDTSHPYEPPSQEVISSINKLVSLCNSSSVIPTLQGQKPNCRKNKSSWEGDSKLLESQNWRI